MKKYGIFSILFLFLSLLGSLYLVKMNQDNRKYALDTYRVDPPNITFTSNKSVKLFFTTKITNNSFIIKLQNINNSNDIITLSTGNSPMPINTTHIFSNILTTGSSPATYRLSVKASRDLSNAYGWVNPNSGETCGKNNSTIVPIGDDINRAQQEADGPFQIQCWADAIIPDDTQDYDFNDWLMIFGYEKPIEISPTPTNTPVPTATGTPKPTNTPVPTATNIPKPTATNTPVPTATNTPAPTATGTPKPTNTPVPTATSTPKPTATGTPQPTATNTPIPPTNTPLPTQVIAQGPSPTRIILLESGIEFPSQILTIFGGIITLLGFLILL
ncbi:MAG: hypothetical protein PHR98_00040 [Candidatus Shapirobacteria bacterium]|jgi:hypothetical protein|nr:hypothetical protein [Candidatus Shapirobacteria bacterium]